LAACYHTGLSIENTNIALPKKEVLNRFAEDATSASVNERSPGVLVISEGLST
jgi:hypothetical protein